MAPTPPDGPSIWEYFTKITDTDGLKKAKCNTCGKHLSNTGGNTKSMNVHLKAMHKKLNDKYESDKEKFEATRVKKRPAEENKGEPEKKQQKLSFEPTGIDPKLQNDFDEAVIDFASENKISFNALGSESFKKMIRVANKKIKVKHRTTYSLMTTKKARKIKMKVMRRILKNRGNMKSVSFTTDMWTSVTGTSFCSLTVQFIDDQFKLHRYTPFCRKFEGNHTGKNIAIELDKMIESLKLDIDDLERWSVNDNASNQKVAIKLSKYLEVYYCDLHTMQLAIRDSFKDVPGINNLLKKTKKMAKFTTKSSKAMDKLKAKSKTLNKKFRKPKNPQKTRWNSQHENMKSIKNLKPQIKELADEDDDWYKLRLKDDEWEKLDAVVEVLEVMKEATKVLEAEKTPTMNLVIERIFTIKEKLEEFSKPGSKRNVATFAKALLERMEQRFPNLGTDIFVRCVANYIDPRYKGGHLEMEHKLEETKQEMEVKYHEKKENEEGMEKENSEKEANLSPTSKMRKKLKDKKDQSNEETNLKKEMNRYESYSYASKEENVLKWWKRHENILPLLSNIAKKVLAIPASSAKSERVFSTGGNVVTKKRNRLAPKKVEELIIIAENGKHVEDEEDIEGEVFDIEDIVDLVEITTTPEVEDSEDSDTEPESDVEDFSEEDDSEEEELVL
jgi:adenylate kinase